MWYYSLYNIMSAKNPTGSGIQSFQLWHSAEPFWITIRAATWPPGFLGNGHHVILAEMVPAAKPVQNGGGQNHGQHFQVKLWSISYPINKNVYVMVTSKNSYSKFRWFHDQLNFLLWSSAFSLYATLPLFSGNTDETKGIILVLGLTYPTPSRLSIWEAP